MEKINLENLDSRCSQQVQAKCKEAILSDPQFDPRRLILPISKYCFGNAAEILAKMPLERLIPIAADLLEWTQDLNWPGIKIVIAIISKMPTEVLLNAFVIAKARATNESDDDWLFNLKLIENPQYMASFISQI